MRARLHRAWSLLGLVASYVAGLGTVVFALFLFGVRPENFARWLVSPVGLAVIGSTATLVIWYHIRVSGR